MSLEKMNKEEGSNMSMIELANLILADEKKEMNFLDLYDKVSTIKQFTETEKSNYLSQFYTDLNVDGRFIALGSNVWGLKRWFPVSKTSEKALAEARKKDSDLLDDEYDEEEYDELYEEDELDEYDTINDDE